MFITMAKEGSTIGGLMDAFGTAVSMSLQYGVPLEDYVRKFSHMRFEPQGYTKNPDIRIAKSVIDYIFRWVGITFMSGYREASMGLAAKSEESTTVDKPKTASLSEEELAKLEAKREEQEKTIANGKGPADAAMLERAGAAIDSEGGGSRSDQFARFQVDAPACDNCGSITVRNGNCYLCHNCGNSMGCS